VILGGVDVAVGQVLAPELRSEEGVQAPLSTAVTGEHEHGHGIVVEGPHQHVGH
jgi:hypothetical protein